MFDFNNNSSVISKVYNPLNITRSSLIEFNIGALAETGLYRFRKIIEFNIGERAYSRYLIYCKSEDTEHIFEVFPGNNDQLETYLYSLSDTIPFSEDFLGIAGQRFLTTPSGEEFIRCIMPDEEDRMEGLAGKAKIYNVETNQLEKVIDIKVWDYNRENEGKTEYLNIEMSEETGMFRIFKGEMIESIFYHFYQTSKNT